MKVSSCTHSFALLALSFFTIHSASALSIDSKGISNLQPRLDGDAVVPDASSSPSPTRRRKKCSFTPPVSGAALSTGAALPLVTGSPAGNADANASPANNASTLANQLSYARSYKKTCTKKTGTVYLPSASTPASGESGSPESTGSSMPESGGTASGGSAESGSSGAGNGGPASSDTAGSPGAESSTQESGQSGDSHSPAAASGQSPVAAASAGVCGPQQTVIVTLQTTVTVTEVAQAANTAPENGFQGPQAAASSGMNAPIENAASASTSTGRKRTNGAKGHASSTATTGGLSSSNTSGSSSSGSTDSTGSTGSTDSTGSTGSTDSVGSSNSGSSSGSGPYGNGTSSGAASPSGSTSPSIPFSGSNTTNTTSNTNLNGQFWAGAAIGTVMRMEAIPSRVFYDYDGKTVKDPIKTLGDAGINALRIEGLRGQCLGPTQFVNNGSTMGDELTFRLDWGCLDIQVKTAQRGVAQGMRVVLTINQGFDIPEGMESYSYEQMVSEVQKEAKRQLQPFLDAKIVPDVILFENEGSDGFLFNETATGHTRGSDDGKVSKAQLDKEKCGLVPTGNIDSFPQYAGYLKAEVMACNDAISAAGLSSATIRYGLHSHGHYVQWKEAVFHGPNPGNQTELKDSSGNICSNSVIPAEILSANASELITIMGFSAYADPMTPVNIDSPSSQHDALNRTLTTLTQLMGYAEAYGKYESGPFAGEYKLQTLGVEYGTSYTNDQIAQEQQITTLMWSLVKQFPNMLGMLWYEPWYCHADWEGGKATLCHNIDTKEISGQAPTDTLKTWGAAALSPWKK